MKPVLKWVGGKAGLITDISPHFPVHFKRYIEPFFGGGAVFFKAIPSHVPAIINDCNDEIMSLYRVIRDDHISLMARLDNLTTQYSEEFYYKVRSEEYMWGVYTAARTIFLNKTGFNGLYRVNKKGQFNSPFGHRKTCPALYDKENIEAISIRLRDKCEILSCDFIEVLAQAGEGDFVYCDPPYEPLIPTSFVAYTKDGFGQDKQVELRDSCIEASKRGAFVIISNSSAQFIKDIYSEHQIIEIQASRSVNSKGDKRGKIPESLILMPPE